MPDRFSFTRRTIGLRLVLAVLAALAACLTTLGQNPDYAAAGVVRDATGSVVPSAAVELTSGTFTARTTTDEQGRFHFEHIPASSATVRVHAPDFAPFEGRWTAGSEPPLEITLRPAPVSQRITVTATRTEAQLRDTAADVVLLTPQVLATSAGQTLDQDLKQVPGFQLFRRSDSLAANPSSQGVSLRGVGASGASRALVMENGLPLSDPFGGYVYWDRVPGTDVSSVEVVRGAASDLYGSDALGGAINILTHQPTQSALELETSYGNNSTPYGSFSSSLSSGGWGFALAGESLHTDGYILVPDDLRGRVDTPAGVDYRSATATLDRTLSQHARVFLNADYLGEGRENGKYLERNHTIIRQAAAGFDWQSETVGAIAARIYGGPEEFDQTFYAVAPDRSTEALTRLQRVPVNYFGGSAQWTRPVGARHTLVAGFDMREERGFSNEFIYSAAPYGSMLVTPSTLSSAVGAGGHQTTFGFYGEDVIRLTERWILTADVRFDHWMNYNALNTTRPLVPVKGVLPPVIVTNFPDRNEQAFSPRLSVLRRVNENVSLNASVYRGFRAPTLNELYRSFRLGSILTLANSNLTAERLTGGEAGASLDRLNHRLNLRATFFAAGINNPVANVTLSSTANLITRQRQNLGSIRSVGFDVDATANLTSSFSLSGGYEYAHATVTSFPANPALVGLWIPQVPRHMLTFQARYSNPRLVTFGLQARAVGAAYDDDQNLLRLNPYFTLDGIVSRSIRHGIELFAAAQNIFDQRYDVALTPTHNLGPPFLIRAGVRLTLGGR
jgi:outer membrane receptor protein involved in Fe transport